MAGQIISQPSQTDHSSLYLIFDGCGSQVEKVGERTCSHILEHLVFGGGYEGGNVNQLMDEFDENGIECNAWTSNSNCVYFISSLDEELNPYIYEFANRICNAEVSEEEFLREKDIILSEYFMTLGSDKETGFIISVDRLCFDAYNPVGFEDDIRNLTYEDFCAFKDKFHKPTKIIYTSKNYELDESQFDFEMVDAEDFENDIRMVSEVKDSNPEAVIEQFADYSDADNCNMIIINKEIIEEDFPKINFVNRLLGGGLNSVLFQEIREKRGLVYNLSLELVPINSKQATIQFHTDTDYNNVSTVEDIYLEVLENSKTHITEGVLDRYRKKSLIQDKKIAIDLYCYPTHGLYPTWDDKSFLETITVEDVHTLIDKYYLDKEVLVITDKDLY